ncbi:MAG TPA: trypsin-like peptidase domain-containing protein [Steroidobacteraceae bacterium]|jgi:S1-C subfamily serine protease|nr:trypsin-like peptidase domain-containing protein [Steroidobacteraceae bacterium]
MTRSKGLALSAVAVLLSASVLAGAALGARTAEPVQSTALENSVVKIFSTMRYPDPFKPWTKQAPSEATASGVVIEGRRILTNAHAVLYASQVQVQANAAGDKVSATVLAIAPGIDLAVLQLDDPSFFDTHPPVARASKLPQIKDPVLAYGFPTGGSSLSITKGIVSRIEFASYNYPVSGLRIQIDAAINPGNSGGPAIAGDKMIGLAFSRLGGDSQNIGYIIPNEEVDLFLKDLAGGHYVGKASMYDDLQTLENPALRDFLKLDKSVEGMIVHRPDKTDASYPLKEWDVITRIGDTPIDNQGMVKIDKDLRVNFGYMIQRLVKDGKLPLTVVRGGKTLKIELPVSAERPTLAADLHGEYPSYFVYGPMVFSRATRQFLSGFENNANLLRLLGFVKSPLVTRVFDTPTPDLEELVIISSPFFPHKLANGYSNPTGSVVYSINGTPIKSLAHLVSVLRDLKDPFVTIEFGSKGGEALVFSRAAIMAATDDILTDNGVRAQGSPDMMAVWQPKPGN